MPVGQKTIIWTPENNEHLLLSILAAHNVKIDTAKVASIFGRGIAASAISGHMSKLKAQAKALAPGVLPTTVNVTTAIHKRASSSSGKNKASKKIKVEESDNDEGVGAGTIATEDVPNDDEEASPPGSPCQEPVYSNGGTNVTPLGNSTSMSAPMTPTRGSKTDDPTTPTFSAITPEPTLRTPRPSPRKTPSKSHAELNDPYEKLERAGLFNDEEMPEGESNITLGEEIVESDYESDDTEDEYEVEDEGDAAIDDLNMEL